ncbi:MAG: hypothetical protein DRN15_08770 [Thermoprotei archaeon]|nr:MAG: hypothetical protein DRN15_08770 [Thermoprotei archaeon]
MKRKPSSGFYEHLFYACFIVMLLGLALISILLMPSLDANLWLIIVNQYGEPISDKVQVITIGGRAELYNETYWLVRTNASEVLVKVYRMGLCVGEFRLKPNGTYRLRVLVGDMLIQAPRSITLKIKLLGTNCTWLLTGESSYILEDLPYATYEFEIVGTNFRKVVYWEGGVITIGKTYEIIPEAVLKAMPFMIAPAIGASVYKLRRRRPKARIRPKKVRKTETKRVKKARGKSRNRKPKTLAEALLMTEV